MLETKQSFNQRYYETIRRAGTLSSLGNVAIKGSHLGELEGYEHRRFDEIYSSLVEGLKGTVSTHYSFELKEGRLVARDGEDIDQLLEHGLQDARQMADEDVFFAEFLPQRSMAELEEHRENQAMAEGLTSFNTNVTISPYTEELAGSEQNRDKLKHAAQKPYWQRAMLRVSHWDGQQLHVFTRSIDNSDVSLLKQAAVQSLGYEYQAATSTEMLGERIHLSAEGDSWKALADNIVAKADAILASRRGGEWKQGRTADDAENLHEFVGRHEDVVQHLISKGRHLSLIHDNYESYKHAFEAEIYKHLALLEERLERNETSEIVDMGAATSAAGAIAEAEGRSYDMCGTIISANAQNQSSAAQTGYESLKRLEGKKISCPECKSKVVVPKEDLEAGKLTCSDCGYGVDVCTGRRLGKSRRKDQKPPQPDFFDMLSSQLQGYANDERQKRELKKLQETEALRLKKEQELSNAA